MPLFYGPAVYLLRKLLRTCINFYFVFCFIFCLLNIASTQLGHAKAITHPLNNLTTTALPLPHDFYLIKNKNNNNNLWSVIIQGFEINHESTNPRVKFFIHYDLTHKNLIMAVLNNSRPVLYLITQAILQRNLPTELALLPAVESGYRLNIPAYTDSGALGLWQLLPQTAQDYGANVDDSYWYDGRMDIQASTWAALSFLAALNQDFNHNWLLSIAAYNSGETTVKNSLVLNTKLGKSKNFFDLQLPEQTQDYVPKLLALCIIIQNAKKYGMTLPIIPNQPLIKKILLTRQINLATAAHLSDTPLAEINQLNADFLYGIVPYKGPSYLYIPSNKVRYFINAANTYNYNNYWHLYAVEPGDFLSIIANQHKTTVSNLIKLNNLNSSVLQPHQKLIIPSASGRLREISKIKPNENLSSFAKHHRLSLSELQFINGLDPIVQKNGPQPAMLLIN